MNVTRLLRVSLTVSDLAAAEAFYRTNLDFVPVAETTINDPAWFRMMGAEGSQARAITMRLGAQELELLSFDPPGQPYPAHSTAHDPWFQHIAIAVSDMAAAWSRLRQAPVTPITRGGPQRLPPNTGSVTAFKFRDPDGHPLELLRFPPGTGDPAWQRKPGDTLFLGIDHSAIVVQDVHRSSLFYMSSLGFSEMSRSRNSGSEQQALDNIGADVVDVVALKPGAETTPHLELLGYHLPPCGKIATVGSARDIGSSRLVLEVTDLSDWPETLQDGSPAATIQDPDGHRLLLIRRGAVGPYVTNSPTSSSR